MFEGIDVYVDITINDIKKLDRIKKNLARTIFSESEKLIKFIQKLKKFSNVVVINNVEYELNSEFLLLPELRKKFWENNDRFYDKYEFKFTFLSMIKKKSRFSFKKDLFSKNEWDFLDFYFKGSNWGYCDLEEEYRNLKKYRNPWKEVILEEIKKLNNLSKYSKFSEKSVNAIKEIIIQLEELIDLDYLIFKDDINVRRLFFKNNLLNRRDFLKLGVWFIGVFSLETFLLNLLSEQREEEIKNTVKIELTEVDKFLSENYGKYLDGIKMIKTFQLPHFNNSNQNNYSNDNLIIHKNLLYNQFKFERTENRFKLINEMLIPNKDFTKFVLRLFDFKKLNEAFIQTYGRISIFNQDYVMIMACLGFVNKNITYVSDYLKSKDINGEVEIGINREKFTPYYDLKDYWKFPEQTLFDGYGDCEDFTILTLNILSVLERKIKSKIKTGFCLLEDYDDFEGHAIIALEVDLEFVEVLLQHLNYSVKNNFGKEYYYPNLYVSNTVSLPFKSKRKLQDNSFDLNQKYILLLEPQRYYNDAGSINLDNYEVKKVYIDNRLFLLNRDFKRVFVNYELDDLGIYNTREFTSNDQKIFDSNIARVVDLGKYKKKNN